MVVPENLDGKSFLLCPRKLYGLMEDESLKGCFKSICTRHLEFCTNFN